MKLLLSFAAGIMMFFQSGNLDALRNAYSTANNSNESAKKFINLAENTSGSDAITTGYKAAADILQAKVTTEKNKRKSFVTKGAKSLESIIASNPNNIELRVIRMSVQENIPKIVGYSKNIKEDKAFLTQNFGKQNSTMKAYIKKFANQSKNFTPTERAQLK